MKYFISNLYDGGLSDEEIDENIIQYYKRVYNLKTELDFDNWSIKFIGDEQNIFKYINSKYIHFYLISTLYKLFIVYLFWDNK